jgi:hypothetical protein
MNICEVNAIKAIVNKSAEDARNDAGYGGRHDDGGASHSLQLLEWWLDGISYAQTGTSKCYGHIIDRMKKEADVEYAEYQRLKMKFEDKK